MKKILLLTPTLPFPPHSGGVIKTNKVAHFLAEKYKLSIACFLKNDDAIYVDEFLENIDLLIFHFRNIRCSENCKELYFIEFARHSTKFIQK
jgi:hypothetical protein